jgi:tetratricopeptide (TPR) repeat protein
MKINKSKSEVRKPRPAILALLLFGIIIGNIIAFGPASGHDFTNWDDDVNIYDNPYTADLSSDNIKAIFTSDVIGNYNPLTILSFAIERHFFGLDPTPYHINNILLHLLVSLLVFAFFLRCDLNIMAAFIATLLFAVHPMRVESVAWVTERKDVLYALFFMASLLSYIRYYKVQKNKTAFYLLSLIFFILSLLSKIQAVALPLAMLCVDYLNKRKGWGKLLIEKAPFLLLSLTTGLIGIYFLSGEGSLDTGKDWGLLHRILVGTYSLMMYILKFILPIRLSAVYPYPAELSWPFYLSPVFLLLLGFLLWKSKNRSRIWIFGFLFFFVNIIFLLQVVGAGQGFLADRFSYIPYIGLSYIPAALLMRLQHKPSSFKTVSAIILLAILIFSGISRSRTAVWKNSETLWTDVIEKRPHVPVAYNNRGKYYRENNDYAKALADYNKAIKYNPEGYMAYNNRGKVYFETERTSEALADYSKAIMLNPSFASALVNRSSVYGKNGELDKALSDLKKALNLEPLSFEAHRNLGQVYALKDMNQEALEAYTFCINSKPDAGLYNSRAVAYQKLNQHNNALRDLNKAIGMDASQGMYFLNRSYSLYAIERWEEALRDATTARTKGASPNEAYIKMLKSKTQ